MSEKKLGSIQDLMESDQEDKKVDLPSSDKVTDLTQLVTSYQDCDNRIKQLELLLKDEKATLRKLGEVDIPEVFIEMGNIQQFTLSSGLKISVKPDCAVSVKKGEEESAFEFLEQHGLGPIIKSNFNITFGKDDQALIDQTRKILNQEGLDHVEKRAVHASTLKSSIKKLTESGTQVPESFNYYSYNKTVIK